MANLSKTTAGQPFITGAAGQPIVGSPEYPTVKSAVDAANAAASVSNPLVVNVPAGVWTEAQITVSSFVTLKGASLSGAASVIKPSVDEQLAEMTAVEKDAVDAPFLDTAKANKRAEIDARTAELIGAGFDYDNGSETLHFSCSLAAQANMTAVYEDRDLLSFPFQYSVDMPDQASYDIASKTELEAIAQAMKAHKIAYIRSGHTLVQQVLDAATVSEVSAIVDSR